MTVSRPPIPRPRRGSGPLSPVSAPVPHGRHTPRTDVEWEAARIVAAAVPSLAFSHALCRGLPYADAAVLADTCRTARIDPTAVTFPDGI